MMNRRLRDIANRQAGYFTAQQARRVGYVQQHHVDHVRRGNWLSIERGLFRLPGYSDSLESEFVRWAFWTVGRSPVRKVVISHDSALAYYGLCQPPHGVVHLTILSERLRKAERPGCVFHRQELPPSDIVQQPGFCITTPARTLGDMKSTLVFGSLWLETVRHAWRTRILDRATAEALLGAVLAKQLEAEGAVRSGHAMIQTRLPEGQNTAPERGRWLREDSLPRTAGRMASTPNRSFTLVEMLVVAVIVCLLAALLLPSLRRVHANATITTCSNNQRLMLAGFSTYSEQNYGRLPTHKAQPINAVSTVYQSTWWMWAMVNLCDVSPSTFACPNNPHNAISDGLPGWTLGMGVDDSWAMVDLARTFYSMNGRLLRVNQYSRPAGGGVGGKLRRVLTPSRSILALEFHVPTMIDGIMQLSQVVTGNTSASVQTRDHYGNGSTFGMVDGHVEKQTYPDSASALYLEGDPATIQNGNWYYGSLWYPL